MKDREEAGEGVGFIHYIVNNKPREWQWLTPDYLWDYFFTRKSDIKNDSPQASDVRKLIHHFQNKENLISDNNAMHVFKAAMLLLAVVSGGSISDIYSKKHQQNRSIRRIGATRNTLYKCFRGQLEQSTIDEYLNSFKEIGILNLGALPGDDARLELPYSGAVDAFDVRLEITKKKNTRHNLFKKGNVKSLEGSFSRAAESAIWDNSKATCGRMYIAVCSSETNSIEARLGEVKKEVESNLYKIGLLVVAIAEKSEFANFQAKIKHYAEEAQSERLVIAMFSEPCTDLNHYREARQCFTTEEWLDVLIGAVDYNPNGYDTEEEKLLFIRRILPFVERRVNMIELAPRGTGKSYVYEKISKRGWVVSGGTVSRASLFYDNNVKMPGLVTRFDYVAFDEIQNMKFLEPAQVQAALTTYMQDGVVKGFDSEIPASSGIIVLGNIEAEKFNTQVNMVNEINPIFRKAETLDRIHGFIPGWKIPKFHQNLVAQGWALNTEYFAEVLHELRDELYYTPLVDSCFDVPPKAYTR
ncbi:MAG: hypothetical protein FWF79_07890 [Defluviitaleaceae bacterium]|nr:hypothetical protein [Defluviitaleaceae bacterium]